MPPQNDPTAAELARLEEAAQFLSMAHRKRWVDVIVTPIFQRTRNDWLLLAEVAAEYSEDQVEELELAAAGYVTRNSMSIQAKKQKTVHVPADLETTDAESDAGGGNTGPPSKDPRRALNHKQTGLAINMTSGTLVLGGSTQPEAARDLTDVHFRLTRSEGEARYLRARVHDLLLDYNRLKGTLEEETAKMRELSDQLDLEKKSGDELRVVVNQFSSRIQKLEDSAQRKPAATGGGPIFGQAPRLFAS